MSTERTYQEFVEDMFSNGRCFGDVLAVARNTRWHAKIDEILEYAQIFIKKFKKLR